MSHKSKSRKFTTDTGEVHNEVVELEVSPAAGSEEEGALAEEDKEQGVEENLNSKVKTSNWTNRNRF